MKNNKIIESDSFKKEIEKAIESGHDFDYNEDGGYNYYNELIAFNEIMKVIKKNLDNE